MGGRCSGAYLFYVLYAVVLVVLPLAATYGSHFFWMKEAVQRVQAKSHFTKDLIIVLRGASVGSEIFYSTSASFNALVANADRSNIRVPEVTYSEDDDNYDGTPDVHRLGISIPLTSQEAVYSVEVFAFVDYKIDTGRPKLHLAQSLLYAGHSASTPGSGLILDGDLSLHQRGPLPSTGTGYDGVKVIDFKSYLTMQECTGEAIIRKHMDKGARTHLDAPYPLWMPGPSSFFNISITARVPKTQAVSYQPSTLDTLTAAWSQYCTVLLPIYYVLWLVKDFVFRNQVLETQVLIDRAAGVGPALKPHQF